MSDQSQVTERRAEDAVFIALCEIARQWVYVLGESS